GRVGALISSGYSSRRAWQDRSCARIYRRGDGIVSSSPAAILKCMGDSSTNVKLSPGGGFLLEPTGTTTVLTPEMLSDEQRMMKETAEDFMRREDEPRISEIEEKKSGVMRAVLEKAGTIGLLGHDVPEEYGGLGGDKTSSSLIFETVSRMGSFAVSYGAHVGIGTMPIVFFGTTEQRRKWLPALASGDAIAAYALTEPGSGSD